LLGVELPEAVGLNVESWLDEALCVHAWLGDTLRDAAWLSVSVCVRVRVAACVGDMEPVPDGVDSCDSVGDADGDSVRETVSVADPL